jgi:hypothetical protein
MFFYSLHAQNWALLSPGETHHFHSDTVVGFPDQSIEVDSITGTAVDSIWHFNRFITLVDLAIAIKNEPAFCQRKMRVHANGWYQFFDPGNIAVHATAAPGETWLLDSLQGYAGLLDAVWAGSVLGVPDSLKRILLSSGDTMILSKNHGLVQWPASLGGHRFVLSSLQLQHLGELVPDFDSLFDYRPGQIFCWLSEHVQNDLQVHYEHARTKMTVLSTVRDSVGLKVYISGIKQGGNGSFPIWYPGVAFALDSFFVVDSARSFVRQHHRELVDMGSWSPSLAFPGNWDYRCLAAGYWDAVHPVLTVSPYQAYSYAERTDGNDTLRLGGTNIPYASLYHATGNDTLDDLYMYIDRFEVICHAPIGLERLYFVGFEIYGNYQLMGYTTTSGDTIGTFWEDTLLLAAVNPLYLNVILYPQPANAIIKFRLPNADPAQVCARWCPCDEADCDPALSRMDDAG